MEECDDSQEEEEAAIKVSHSQNSPTLDTIQKQLTEINMKFNNVVPTVVLMVKEEMLKIFEVKIEKLEARLFDFEKENDSLKSQIKKHKKEIERKEDAAKQSVVDLEQTILLQGERINDFDQYSKRNNVVITGIKEDNKATKIAEKTAEIVVNILKDKMKDLQLNVNDMDISHRMGRKQVDYKRPIIVRFL